MRTPRPRKALFIAAATAAALVGCSKGDGTLDPMTTLQGPPASWSLGTGGMLGEYEEHLTSSAGANRRYAMYVPTGYDASKGTPLLIHHHGLADSLPYDIKKKLDTLWVPTAEAQGFLAVAPEASPCEQVPNNPAPVGCWRPKVDGPFIKELVAHLATQYNVNRSRVYLSGHSNGAFFVDGIGLLDADTYAAVVEFDGGCSPDVHQDTSCPTLQKWSMASTRKAPYFTIHYPDDQNVPSSWTAALIEILDADGHFTKQLDNYDTYDAGGHGHTPDPNYVPAIWAWMSTFTL